MRAQMSWGALAKGSEAGRSDHSPLVDAGAVACGSYALVQRNTDWRAELVSNLIPTTTVVLVVPR